jgi:Tfp pilus assembly protein PilN
MIIINLLSPKQKQEIKIKRICIIIRELVMLFLLFTSIIAIFLVASKYYLEQQLTDLIIKNASEIKISQEINRQITIINQKIDDLEKIQQDFHHWSSFFAEISALTPDDIYLQSSKINSQDSTFKLSGIAATRDSLINFKEKIENSPLFSKVNLPLVDLLAKTNNKFNIETEINLKNIP